MTAKNQKLLDEIEKGFNDVHRRTDIKKRIDWTREFFEVLRNIGEKEYKVYTHSSKKKVRSQKGGGEWLFDLCWSDEGMREDDWKRKFKGLKLICECEWNNSDDEILYDFQKLVVGKAEIKIMIVQYDDYNPFDRIKEWCEASVDKSLYDDGAVYILMGSGNRGKNIDKVRFEELWKK